MKWIKLICLFLFVGVLVWLLNGKESPIIIISEIVANNTYTIKDEDGDYSDYIEIYNNSNIAIALGDYYLSDSTDFKKWRFPDIKIEPKEYLLVFCSGKDKKSNELHTNFKLSSKGETITLIGNNGNIITKVAYPILSNDISYSYVNKKYIKQAPTPNQKNQVDNSNKESKILITEYMIHNKNTIYLSNGGYYDWIELYNPNDTNINLSSYYLSDDLKELNKYKLPNINIKPKEYVLVYFTGKELVPDYICANFKLSKDEELILSYNGNIITKLKIKDLPNDISYGLYNDEWYYYSKATPGKNNLSNGFKELK